MGTLFKFRDSEMDFEIRDKVALVTGGASGIGLAIVKAPLKNGVRGILVADINEKPGKEAIRELISNYGADRVTFLKTDVTDMNSFENAFKEAIRRFGHINMLFNNAGIFDENKWEKVIDVNLKGVMNGMVLAVEKYLKNHKKGDEALIINTSSIGIFELIQPFPIYTTTKCGVYVLTKFYGNKYYLNSSKVKTIAICPGKTETPMLEVASNSVKPEFRHLLDEIVDSFKGQSAEFVADETMKLIPKAPTGSVWVIEENIPAYEHISSPQQIFERNIKSKY